MPPLILFNTPATLANDATPVLDYWGRLEQTHL
eukprot:SAG11_NODE_7605_length_1122_cov_0.935484_2_plen_32_part_01